MNIRTRLVAAILLAANLPLALSGPSPVDAAFTQAAKLTNSAGIAVDGLGWSVAVSSDGSTVAVGAPNDDTHGADRGAVYVYTRPTTGWATATNPNAKLTVDTVGGSNDVGQLGSSVSISSDGNTIVAGAPKDHANGTERGAAYVFVKNTNWSNTSTPTAKLSNQSDSPNNNDYLGSSVSISADGSTVVAGAPGDNRAARTRARRLCSCGPVATGPARPPPTPSSPTAQARPAMALAQASALAATAQPWLSAPPTMIRVRLTRIRAARTSSSVAVAGPQ